MNIQDNKNIDSDAGGLANGGDIIPKGQGFFKDLFIPHVGNNYKPHALHTKRLIFYSFSAILIKAIVIGLALSFPIQAWLTPDLLSEQSARIVELTNNIRAGLNLNLLRNSDVLQQAALSKAEDMLVNQYFAHVSPDNKGLKYWLQSKNYNYSVAGENLALGYADPEAVIEAWKASPTHYANLVDPDYKDIGVAMIAGNYQGYDTTLVAQYFGTLKAEPKTVGPTPVVIIPESTVTSTSTNQTSTSTVLSDKALPTPDNSVTTPLPVAPVSKPVSAKLVLSVPHLVSPADNFLTKDSHIHLEIDAPQADELIVWVNKQAVWQSQVTTENITTDLVLPEGDNKIILQAKGLSQSVYSPAYTVNVDLTPPQIDQERTRVSALQSSGQTDVVIKAEAYLSADTKTAVIKLGGYNIQLQQDNIDPQKWTGHLILSKADSEKISDPIVPATLSAVDLAGNTTVEDITWESVLPKEVGPINQYLFLKNSQSRFTAPLFDISSIYYKFVLVFSCLALLLNIFIEVKKQHPKTIASTLGLIALLIVLILI